MLVAIGLFFAIFGIFSLFATTYLAASAAYTVGASQSFMVGVFLALALVVVSAAKLFGVVCAAFSTQRWCRHAGLGITIACAAVSGSCTYWDAAHTLKAPAIEVFPGLSPALFIQVLALLMAAAIEVFAVGATLTALEIVGGRRNARA